MAMGPCPIFEAIPLGPNPMEVTIDPAQWVRERMAEGKDRLLVVFCDWDTPNPAAPHPDDEALRAELALLDGATLYTLTAAQAASWAGLGDMTIEVVLIVHNVPSSARWRVAAVAGQKGCPVWHQIGGDRCMICGETRTRLYQDCANEDGTRYATACHGCLVRHRLTPATGQEQPG